MFVVAVHRNCGCSRRRTLPRVILTAAVATAIFAPIGTTATAPAAVQSAVWIGGSADGNWSTPSKWSGGVVPNNTAEHQFDVTIDDNSGVAAFVLGMPATVNSVTVNAGDTLRIEDTNPNAALTALNGFHVDGRITTAYSQLKVGANSAFTGTGIIDSFGAMSLLKAAGGSLTIGTGVTVKATGDWFSPHASVGETSYPLINNGTIWAVDPFTQATVAGSTLTNNGTLRVGDRATLTIDTHFQQLSDLGAIVADGTGIVRILGTLDNTGRTLHIDGSLPLRFGGTILGGTITASNGQRFLVSGAARFDGVTLDAPATIDGTLTVPTNQGVNGTADVLLSKPFAALLSDGGTFTVGSGITARGQGSVGSPGAQLINQGRLIAEQPDGKLTITGNGWVNQGTIEVKPGATLAIAGTVRTSDLGKIINDGGKLSIVGTLDNRGQTLAVGAPHAWTLDNGRILGGTITTAPGKNLVISNFTAGTLDGVTLDNATVQIATNGGPTTLYLPNGIFGNGTILSPVSGIQRIRSDASFSNKIEIGDSVTVRAASLDISANTKPVEIHGAVEATGGVFGSTVQMSGSAVLVDGALRANRRGRFDTSALTFGDGGRFIVELDAFQPGKLDVFGNLDLSSDDFLDLLPPSQVGAGPYTIASYTGTLAGVFDHVMPGYTVDYSQPGRISVSLIPEPATATLLLAFATLTMVTRRRRR